jgi:hypothetical protein
MSGVTVAHFAGGDAAIRPQELAEAQHWHGGIFKLWENFGEVVNAHGKQIWRDSVWKFREERPYPWQSRNAIGEAKVVKATPLECPIMRCHVCNEARHTRHSRIRFTHGTVCNSFL